jgi:hypothetical protein
MKKAFLSLILISLLAVIALPTMVLAQPVESCTLRHDLTDFDAGCDIGLVDESVTSAWGMCCMLDAIYTVVDWIFFGLIALVALFTILGAFDILTAAGDPEKVSKGRARIMYAMIGLAIALLSRAVPSVVKALIGT